MNNVSFYGGESTGSVGNRFPDEKSMASKIYLNNTLANDTACFKSAKGGESTGSVGVKIPNEDELITGNTGCDGDTVCFKGGYYEKPESSLSSKILKALIGIGVVVGGLGYLQKAKAGGKISSDKIKKAVEKINFVTEPCYNVCHKIKEFGIKCLKKIGIKK